MNPYKARKMAKVIAIIIVVALVITSFSFIGLLPGAVGEMGAAGSAVYAAESEQITSQAQLEKELSYLTEFIKNIQENYKDKVSYDQLVNGAFNGVMDSLDDPYSVYYSTQEEEENFVQSVEGEFGGIGVSVENADGKCRVVAPIPGTPADKAGVRTGDIIIKVDGVSTEGKSLTEVVSLMKGELGTKVTITVDRSGQTLDFTMTRETIRSVSVYSELMENGVGYIQITQFDSDSHKEFLQARLKLAKEGAKSLIIDVRNNPGGVVGAATDIANQLMTEGPIMYFEQQGKIVETVSATGQADTKTPVVLLVNGGSASASEILAGALKDSKRATLVGTTTYGKGVAQQVITMNNGAGIKLSKYYFLTPNKMKLDHVGITPDVVVQNYKGEDQDALYEKYTGFAPMSEKVKPQAGETGLNVYGAQQRLAFLGYKVTVNGTMDEATVTAVKSFQSSQGYKPYGTLDYSTMTALDKAAQSHVLGTDNTKDVQLEKAVELLSK